MKIIIVSYDECGAHIRFETKNKEKTYFFQCGFKGYLHCNVFDECKLTEQQKFALSQVLVVLENKIKELSKIEVIWECK